MANGRFVAYHRVSTARQGASGLGLEAQKDAVRSFLNGGSWTLTAELTEVESGKNDDNRPQLAEAFRLCRLHNATLVIAKLDRLSRDAHFLLGLQKAQVRFVCCDMPDANELTIGIMAVVAQAERKAISKRTKEALAAAKKKGVKLGGDRGNFANVRTLGPAASRKVRAEKAHSRAADVLPAILDIQASGASLRGVAAELTARGIPAPRGGAWAAIQVSRILARHAA